MAGPLPEPAPHVVPKMTDATKKDDPIVWRVKEIELDDLVKWLIPELKDKWPRLNEEGVWFWLKAVIGDRQTLFCRTRNVVGMFHSSTDVLEPWPIIREKFVRSRQSSAEEQVELYRFVKAWGKQIGAREVRFAEDSDASIQLHVAPGLQTPETMVRRRATYSVTLKE